MDSDSDFQACDLSRERLSQMWKSHIDEFRRFGRLNDIEKAIEYGTHALGSHLKRLGNHADLDSAIEHFCNALSLTPEGHQICRLACWPRRVIWGSYRSLGELADLEKATEYISRAVALTPDGHPDLPGRCANLEGNRMGSSALMLTPEGHPDLPDWHAGLATSYGHRYKRLGELSDLEKSTKFSLMRSIYSRRPPTCQTGALVLGHHTLTGINAWGKLTDLESAIVYDLRALTLTPEGHPRLPDRHASLGVSHGDRYRRLGELADLRNRSNTSIELFYLPPRDIRIPQTGELIDLENSVVCNTRALTLTPHGHPDLSDRHANTGASYIDRFWRLGELSDLQEAIEFFSRALELTSDGHAELPGRYANLGLSYSSRYRRLDELADLEKSIEYRSHALALTPKNHPHLSDRHADLGVSYTDRYQRLGEVSDLQK
ncbi:hypothetical protein RHS01_04554 [Rhizoctonia solani]|uniref:Uncharacterized protein n=1 Tax=Rhizoctonia solani TaxID=456999 RepID=A0A8H7M7Q1_9AGAM|nr:hypothetical protein RHS01_04554 [Rhizoctonia solani]